jgi:hypothetical protein
MLYMTADRTAAQTMQLTEVFITMKPTLKEGVDPEAYEAYISGQAASELSEARPGAELHLFKADRGERTGEHLLVWTLSDDIERAREYPVPFGPDLIETSFSSEHESFVSAWDPYAQYALIGRERIGDFPAVDILGIHHVHVKPDRRDGFEVFVRDTLYQALDGWAPGMHLLYYRRVSGKSPGDYIALFAIETPADRELYWPTGAPETDALSAAFRPLRGLARSLEKYLVEGTYLLPDSGAAGAYFESLEWNDFVHVGAQRR